MGIAPLRTDKIVLAAERFVRQGLGREAEDTAGIQTVCGSFHNPLHLAEIGENVRRRDQVIDRALAVLVLELFQKGDRLANVEVGIDLPVEGDLDDLLGQVDTRHRLADIAQRLTGQPGAAAKVQTSPKRPRCMGAQLLAQEERHAVAELIDENGLEHICMLIEERRDISLRHGLGCGIAAHGRKTHAGAAMVFRVDGQGFPVGSFCAIQISGLFQIKAPVVDLGQRFLVKGCGLFFFGHGQPFPACGTSDRLLPLSTRKGQAQSPCWRADQRSVNSRLQLSEAKPPA